MGVESGPQVSEVGNHAQRAGVLNWQSGTLLLPRCPPRGQLGGKQTPKLSSRGQVWTTCSLSHRLGSGVLCPHTLRATCPLPTWLPSSVGGQKPWALSSGVGPGRGQAGLHSPHPHSHSHLKGVLPGPNPPHLAKLRRDWTSSLTSPCRELPTCYP